MRKIKIAVLWLLQFIKPFARAYAAERASDIMDKTLRQTGKVCDTVEYAIKVKHSQLLELSKLSKGETKKAEQIRARLDRLQVVISDGRRELVKMKKIIDALK